jgi:hypothetical protein
MREWDPIGVQGIPEAADEYDSYIGKAYAMLMDEHASAAAIEAYLLKIATEYMGMDATDDLIERCARTASHLIELRPVFEKEHKQLN